jgi:hypothetical protein
LKAMGDLGYSGSVRHQVYSILLFLTWNLDILLDSRCTFPCKKSAKTFRVFVLRRRSPSAIL